MKRKTIYYDEDVEYVFEPASEVMKQRVKGKLVVGYLANDFDPVNPMTEWDGQGKLYTCREGVITDDGAAPAYLGLESFDSCYGVTKNLDLDAVAEAVAAKLKEKIAASPSMQDWFDNLLVECCTDEFVMRDKIVGKHDGYRTGIAWDEEDDENIASLMGGIDKEEIWDELFSQGKIGDRLAVPVRYCANNHGPGTTGIDTCDIGDANAVWVPDESCLENMTLTGDYATDFKTAEAYAKSVLDEYAKWCNGEVYGVCVHVYGEDKTDPEDRDEECWGFIGADYANEGLASRFETVCRRVERKHDEEVRTQCGRQMEMVL